MNGEAPTARQKRTKKPSVRLGASREQMDERLDPGPNRNNNDNDEQENEKKSLGIERERQQLIGNKGEPTSTVINMIATVTLSPPLIKPLLQPPLQGLTWLFWKIWVL